MQQLYPELVELLTHGQPFSLATVVHTSGSTPQKAGARAIFLPDGRVLGTLGGGCMEMESRRRALELIQSPPSAPASEDPASGAPPLLLDLHLDDDFGWDDGLICGGSAQIFIQPMSAATSEVYAAALALHAERGRGALVSLVSGGPPEALGRPVLIREDGTAAGELPPSPLGEA